MKANLALVFGVGNFLDVEYVCFEFVLLAQETLEAIVAAFVGSGEGPVKNECVTDEEG